MPHFTLDVENKPPFITIAQSLQASFAQGGVKVDLLPAAGNQVYARVRAKQHQAAIRLWIPDYFDAHSMPAPLPGTMVNPAPWPAQRLADP